MQDGLYNPRTLGPREGQVLAWLETERPSVIEVGDVAAAVGISREHARTVASRLERKGWLARLSRGRYQPLLGDTGGWTAPDPWAALDGWARPHYVSFASAAHELGLTSDRPGDVQVATVQGVGLPPRMASAGVRLVRMRRFTLTGSAKRRLHGHEVWIAGPERCILDSATHLALAGGALGLARMIARAHRSLDWQQLVQMSEQLPLGAPALRRFGALLEVLGLEIPAALQRGAVVTTCRPIPLDDAVPVQHATVVLGRWMVALNVSPEAIREEVRR